MRTTYLVLAAMLFVACKNKAPVDAVPEKTSCASDDDCVISCASKDNCCSSPCCETAVLRDHAASIERYNEEHCPKGPNASNCPTVGGCAGPPSVAHCRKGACVAEKPSSPAKPVDPAAAYDKGCTIDDDCTVVNASPCDKCGCAQTPIAKKDAEKFRTDHAVAQCPPSKDDKVCGECMSPVAVCKDGTCATK